MHPTPTPYTRREQRNGNQKPEMPYIPKLQHRQTREVPPLRNLPSSGARPGAGVPCNGAKIGGVNPIANMYPVSTNPFKGNDGKLKGTKMTFVEKITVLDLLIETLCQHEKELDELVGRLAEVLARYEKGVPPNFQHTYRKRDEVKCG